MVFAARILGNRQGGGFLQDTTSRLMGLIVLAIGVQFALTGVHAFRP
jgi:small neutral amino acid transporter SnatA (MarC family)